MASKSLGTLTVDLVAKIAGFEQGLDRAGRTMDKRMREIERRAKIAGTAIGVGLAAAGALAARSIKSAIDQADEMSKLASKIGIGTKELSRLAYAAELSDVSMESLGNAVKRLGQFQVEVIKGGKEQAAILKSIGIEAQDASTGGLRNAEDMLRDLADVFAAMPDGANKTALAVKLLGKSGADLIPLLNGGSKSLDEFAKKSDLVGYTLSEKTGKDAELFNDTLTEMSLSVDGLWRDSLPKLLPKMQDFAGLLNSEEFREGFQTIVNGAVTGALALAKFTTTLANTMTFLGEEFSARVNGPSLEDTVRISDRIDRLKETMTAVREAGPLNLAILDASELIPSDLVSTKDTILKRLQGELDKEQNRLKVGIQLNEEAAIAAARIAADAAKPLQAPGINPDFTGGTDTATGGKSPQKMADDAARAAREAADAQHQWHQTILDMQATLAGPAAEVHREYERDISDLNTAFNQGRVVLADYARAEELLTEKRDRALEAIKATRTPAEQMLADLALESELLGKTREQQELLNAARYLGAEAATEQGQAALKALEDLQAQSKAIQEQVDILDGARDSARGFLDDLREGEGVWNSLKNAADSFAETLYNLAADQIIEQLFGQRGTTQTRSSGGWLGALFGGGSGSSQGSLMDLFSGSWGFAGGGTMGPNSVARVNERGFEMATVNGNDYLLTGDKSVEITPNHALGSGVTMNNQFHFAAPTEVRTQQQMASRVGFEVGRAQRRNGS